MANPEFIKVFTADAAIGKFRIVKAGAADNSVALGAAATDKVLGVANSLGADAAGDRVDVVLGGSADVVYGGTVAAGDLLTSDAAGAAVTAAPAAGVNNRVVGLALKAGVAGDIGSVLIFPSQIQG